MFEAVIFDWDGTLADTEQVVVLSFQKVLKELGCEVSDKFLERLIGIGARNMFKEALKTANIPFDEKVINHLVERKNKIHARLTEKVRLFDGSIDVLDSLKGKVRIALATMSSRKVIDKALAEKGITGYFDFVLTADEVQQPKPNPEAFLKCAKELKCQPESCVVVEDSVFGVIAARRANMKCIAVPSGAYSIEELKEENPDLLVNSIKEKQKILDFILG